MSQIVLTEEKETLLIPLYGKARDYGKDRSILNDKKAAEIVNAIDYNFRSLKIAEKTDVMMCLRAKLIDNFVREFLENGTNAETTALHLGCGLDSRYDRIGDRNVDWFDVDFKEVIDIRKNFYLETEHYHMVSSSVTEHDWIERIPNDRERCIVIAEGLFMYLKEEEIKTLLGRLKERIGRYSLIFDAYSTLTAKNTKNHPSLKKTGAQIHWGVDDPLRLTEWGLDLKFLEEQYFTSNGEIRNLDFSSRLLFRIAGLFPAARKAHRILTYTAG